MYHNYQRFSRKNLFRSYKFKYFSGDIDQLDGACKATSDLIYKKTFYIQGIERGVSKGKPVYSIKDFRSDIVIQKVNDNLKRAYGVNTVSRELIVKQLINLLLDEYPKKIVRLDIRSFFETFNFNIIHRKLVIDNKISQETMEFLRQLMRNCDSIGVQGLPRGVSISSTLSEIAFQDIDRNIRSIDGVYFYSRFVDDIVLLTFDNPSFLRKQVSEILSEYGFELNLDKGKSAIVESVPGNAGLDFSKFDYLGYEFSVPSSNKKAKNLEVRVSQKKLNKIKTRLVRSVIAYAHDSDWQLLVDRFKFLTGLSPIYSKARRRTGLKSGLRFSYRYINKYHQLEELDTFKGKLLYSRKGNFSKRYASKIPSVYKRELAKISFAASFHNYRYYNFSLKRLSEIMEAFRE